MREQIIVLPKGLGRACDNDLSTALERGELRHCVRCSDSVIEAYHSPGHERHQRPAITRAHVWIGNVYWHFYWRLDYALWRIKQELRIVFKFS